MSGLPKTIIRAKKSGYKVTRLVQYFIEYGGVVYSMPYEGHYEYAYNWRRKRKCLKKKQ